MPTQTNNAAAAPKVGPGAVPGTALDKASGNPSGQADAQLSAQPSSSGVSLLSFTLLALLWAGLTFVLAREFAVNEIWVVVLGVWAFSIPLMLNGVYAGTVRQIRRLTLFAHRGWFHRLLSGRLLKTLLWFCWAVGSSFFMLIQFHTYTELEWAAFFLVIPVFWLVFALCRALIARELKPYLVTGLALTWARRICPLLMLLVNAGLILHLAAPPEYPSIPEAIANHKSATATMTGSALVWEAAQYLAVYDGLKAYALGRIGQVDALPALVLFALGSLVVFYNACAMLSCFLIPVAEYRRVFGPLSDADVPPPVPAARMAAVTAVFTFVSLFLYVPTFSALENWIRFSPEPRQAREQAEAWAVPRLEQIDDLFFRPGTIEKLHHAELEALRQAEISLAHLVGQADRAFDRMEVNVDAYLDWYYSVFAEYARIANLLVGELEDYMAQKMEEKLLQGVSMDGLEQAIQTALHEHETALYAYQKKVERIMAENQVELAPGSRFEVVRQVAMHDLLVHDDLIGFRSRMLASGGAGGVAGGVSGVLAAVMVKKIVGKVAGKSVFKLAAKSAAKLAVGKAAGSAGGAAAGAAAGAAIGSVVPILGTAAGAVIGGIVGGVVTGLAVDKTLLVLEEAVSRDEFKREILASINEQRREFKARLRIV